MCTKEAMNIVMGMFNSSLDIDKDLGWEEGGQGNVSLPPQNGQQVSIVDVKLYTIIELSNVYSFERSAVSFNCLFLLLDLVL